MISLSGETDDFISNKKWNGINIDIFGLQFVQQDLQLAGEKKIQFNSHNDAKM